MKRPIRLRYAGRCAECGATLKPGTLARWYGRGRVYGLECHEDTRTDAEKTEQLANSRQRWASYMNESHV